MNLPPCLVIESIQVEGEQVSAELRIGPRRRRLVIDLTYIIGYEQMPSELERSERPKRAVFDVMIRAHQGETVGLPIDLSDMVHDVYDAWPWFKAQESGQPDSELAVEVSSVERDQPELGLETVHMTVQGVPTVVIADNRNRKRWDNASTLYCFASGVHPWQLTDEESRAMLLAIDKVLEGGMTF